GVDIERLELRAVLFEVEEAVAENAESRQRFADRGFDRTKIFAHDGHVIAHALECENAHKILAALAHVRAVHRIGAIGNPEEAEQTYHVIDAERSAVTAVFADRLGEKTVAIRSMPCGVRRRERPVLTFR